MQRAHLPFSTGYQAGARIDWQDTFVGGEITNAGGLEAHDLARWDGSIWRDAGLSGIGTTVHDLAASDNSPYAAGAFSQIGGVAARGIARWNGSSWHALGTGLGGYATALTQADGVLYVGRLFSSAGNVAANNLARWSAGHWRSVGTGPRNGVDGRVEALAVLGKTLHVGGGFLHAGGQISTGYAEWIIPETPIFDSGFEAPGLPARAGNR